MNKPNTKCRVCRKEYFCCSDSKKINSWRAMACSPECFQEYMNRIEKSRTPAIEVNPKSGNEETTVALMKSRKKNSSDSKISSDSIIIEN